MDRRCICGEDGEYVRIREGVEQYACHESFGCYRVETKHQAYSVPLNLLVVCEDCGTETNKPYDNGDDKDRCEPCAVKRYKRSAVAMLWPQNKLCSNCRA